MEALRRELPRLLRLAGPVVAAELGWMAMWLVDIMMVGRVSTEAIAAVSLGGHLFYTVAVFGMGVLLGLDYLVAASFGAGRLADAHAALVDGVVVSVLLTAALTAVVVGAIPLLPRLGIDAAVLAQATAYLHAMVWSLLPLLLFTALRRYLQGIGCVTPIMVTLVSANVVNAAACWILVFGHLGAPALGARGAGWATCLSRVYMFVALLAYALVRERRTPTGLGTIRPRLEWERIGRLLRLGLPAALQLTLEVGVFGVAAALAAMLNPTALAAHQLALSAAALSFMVPLGISSAGAVLVGQAIGRGDGAGAARAGFAALVVGAGFMLTAAAVFLAVPRAILGVFTTEPAVIETGVALLRVAAFFQLFDGIQVVATGALRGTGDTRTPMLANLVGHWALGLPLGTLLCFRLEQGIVGLWWGLSLGLVAVALALLSVWTRRVRVFSARYAPAAPATRHA